MVSLAVNAQGELVVVSLVTGGCDVRRGIIRLDAGSPRHPTSEGLALRRGFLRAKTVPAGRHREAAVLRGNYSFEDLATFFARL